MHLPPRIGSNGMTPSLFDARPRYIDFLDAAVPDALERFDPKTGRFLTNGGWAVTNQDIIYPLAFLQSCSGSRYYRDETLTEFMYRGGDALREFQNPDGTVEFVKVDGSTWGPIYMPWTMYHWLEAFALLEGDLDGARKRRWEEGLDIAFRGIADSLDRLDVHNIPVWNGAATWRAGMIFHNQKWKAVGARMIERAVEGQDPGGFWPEHGGPTPLYNLVYLHALGLYHAFSGDPSVLDVIERATDFHIRYTYPDGRQVETIDGRVKYHDRIPLSGYVGLQFTPRGRRLIEFYLDQNPRPLLEPRIASSCAHCVPGPTGEIPQEKPEYESIEEGVAITRRSRGWYLCLSLFTTPKVAERWGQDRQNFISIFNEEYGLVVGGGNSKDQPEWSSFLLSSDPTAIPDDARYIKADMKSEIQSRGVDGFSDVTASQAARGHYRIGYRIGEATVELNVIIDSVGVRLEYASGIDARLQLPLRLRRGMLVETNSGISRTVGESAIHLDSSAGNSITFANISVEIDGDWNLMWPSYPFNPYAKEGTAPSEDAVAILTLKVQSGSVYLSRQ